MSERTRTYLAIVAPLTSPAAPVHARKSILAFGILGGLSPRISSRVSAERCAARTLKMMGEDIPAARQRNDIGKIGLSLGDCALELLSPVQPIGRVLDTGRSTRSAPERMGGTSRTKFKGATPGGEKGSDLLQKLAARGRKDPGGNLRGGLTPALVGLNEALKLTFERSIGRSRIGFSDNPSELLSAFRHAFEVSARF